MDDDALAVFIKSTEDARKRNSSKLEGGVRFKETPLKTICSSCSLEAQRVETVLEERTYGDQLMISIVARMFWHLYENGAKKACRENLEHPWILTLCGIQEADRAREVYRREMAKQQVTTGMRVF